MKNNTEQLIQDRIRELRENTDFTSTLFESLIGYAIIAADFDGNIIAYNEGAHQIYGYSPEEIIGRQNIEIFFPKDFIKSGKLEKLINNLMGKERFSYEGVKVRKNSERFPAQVLFTLTRDKNGKVAGFIMIVEDLTERKRAEELEAKARANVERIGQLERELHNLEKLTGSPQTSITAQTFGLGPLSKNIPEIFTGLVKRYEDLIELAMEQRIYKVEHNISENIRAIAEDLGLLKAGPRDVVEIHSTALKGKTSVAANQKAQAYVEEGRLMVLELMGYLTSFYRNYFMSGM